MPHDQKLLCHEGSREFGLLDKGVRIVAAFAISVDAAIGRVKFNALAAGKTGTQ